MFVTNKSKFYKQQAVLPLYIHPEQFKIWSDEITIKIGQKIFYY